MARLKTRKFVVSFDAQRGRHVAKDDAGELLGVDLLRSRAIGSAVREANMASREGVRVIVMVEDAKGKKRQEYIADPPPAKR